MDVKSSATHTTCAPGARDAAAMPMTCEAVPARATLSPSAQTIDAYAARARSTHAAHASVSQRPVAHRSAARLSAATDARGGSPTDAVLRWFAASANSVVGRGRAMPPWSVRDEGGTILHFLYPHLDVIMVL